MRSGERRWVNVTTFVYPTRDRAIGAVIVHLFRDATEKMRQQQFIDQVLSASERLQDEDGDVSSSVTARRAAGERLGNGQSGDGRPGYQLTGREWEVLKLLAEGAGTKDMATKLTVTPSTVRNHVQNVLNKLGVHSRLEAIAYAYQHGLIKSEEL
jgi:DNA-binding NarL/FixJ family response regulator